MRRRRKEVLDAEHRVELLKERIYATLALLAVLLTLDAASTSPLKASVIVLGTALSLWAASLVAGVMAYRVVMQQNTPEHRFRRQLVLHSPLLAAAVFPLLMIGFAAAGFWSLAAAIDVAIGALMLFLLGWSLLSARALKVSRPMTLVLAVVELGLGLVIIWLKTAVER